MSEGPEPHQIAFSVFCSDGEQDTGKTAEITGISRRTIQYWAKRDDWRGQWLTIGAPEAERAALQGKTMMRHGMPLVARRLLSIVGDLAPLRTSLGAIITDANGHPIMTWSSSDRDAVQAAKLLALYALGTPLSATEVGDSSILTASYSMANDPEPETGDESVADLRRMASAMLEETVQSVNTRVSSSNRRGKRV